MTTVQTKRTRITFKRRPCHIPCLSSRPSLFLIVIVIPLTTLVLLVPVHNIFHQHEPVMILSKTNSQKIPPRSLPLHLLQVGPQRTASTLQFEILCLCQLLQLVYHEKMDQARKLKCIFQGNINDVFGKNNNNVDGNGGSGSGSKVGDGPVPMVIKSHTIQQEEYNNNKAVTVDKQNLWVFATATDQREAQKIYNDLTSQLFQVKHIRDFESLLTMKNVKAGYNDHYIGNSYFGSEVTNYDGIIGNNNDNSKDNIHIDTYSGVTGGLEQYIHYYATTIFGLPLEPQTKQMFEFMRYWNILRRCCGAQMSQRWRTKLQKFYQIDKDNSFSSASDLYNLNTNRDCSVYDIDSVEKLFMNTTLYQDIHSNFPTVADQLLRPSDVDDELFGTYCSQYNQLVATEQVRFNQNAGKLIDRNKK